MISHFYDFLIVGTLLFDTTSNDGYNGDNVN